MVAGRGLRRRHSLDVVQRLEERGPQRRDRKYGRVDILRRPHFTGVRTAAAGRDGHHIARANRPDYRLEVGHAEVPVGEPRGFSVLDPGRAATLRAWVATLTPGQGAAA